ncbi:dipeptide/oligopeptide/nickel ABC transporter permease/ATP-binding protein [Salinibacterium hongtaonis]|uniref:dipeptide/oligopeptide/nickel ABC transporter permease/ATP-binding protein n=1 Tax=Homoserinimonas hongtaonis TaxID=2079791 RepID=UPI000D3C33FE|nr:dipeptide/oligopeptide/nickel ABC transporter permease/ATP-binding protein [Salinibacterium hongtaonis]AWB90324.1 dipeptide/oligopeptide/nickel ABC transporter ATP-binding protein [Salinibacterium hongtaonis]
MMTTRSLALPRPKPVRGPFSRLMRRPLAVAAASVLFVIIGACLMAPFLPIPGPNEINLVRSLAGPSPEHLLGTDQLGRDLLSRLLFGGIPSFGYAGIVLFVSLALGIPLGICAGYLGGWWDRAIATIADIGLAMPVLIMTIVILSVFDGLFWVAMALLGVLMCPPVIRNVRGAVIAVRHENFVDAARVAGLSPVRIMATHILARIVGPLLVQATLIAALGISFTVGLAFLGFGPQPPDPTWGGMIQDAVLVLSRSQWPMFVAGVVLAISVLALTVLGDTVREATVDPWTGVSRRRRKTEPSLPVEPGSALVAVRDLKVEYSAGGRDVLVVDGVSFDIGPGEAVGLVGESGCGKSTVARAIARILPAAGRTVGGGVRFRDQAVLDLEGKPLQSYRGGSVAYVFQDPMGTLEPSMRVGDLLAHIVRLNHRVSRAEAKARALELLRRVQIADAEVVGRRYPHELSGGLAQRVAIARAIAGEPALLIADEPTTALDASIRLGILDLLRSLQRETGMALLIVSHDWDVVDYLCDRAIVMYAGQITESGRLEDLLVNSAHPYTHALLECRPKADSDRSKPLPSIAGQVAAPGSHRAACRFSDRCPIAKPVCTQSHIPLVQVGVDQQSRCLFAEELYVAPVSVVLTERI